MLQCFPFFFSGEWCDGEEQTMEKQIKSTSFLFYFFCPFLLRSTYLLMFEVVSWDNLKF